MLQHIGLSQKIVQILKRRKGNILETVPHRNIIHKTYGYIILETVAAQIKKCERIGNTLIKRQRVRHLINALRSEAAMGECQLAETLGYLGYGASQVDGA